MGQRMNQTEARQQFELNANKTQLSGGPLSWDKES